MNYLDNVTKLFIKDKINFFLISIKILNFYHVSLHIHEVVYYNKYFNM